MSEAQTMTPHMLKILGYFYTVDRSKTVDEIGAAGRHHVRTMTIQIASDLERQQGESAILHEVLEALNYSLELKLEHPVLSALEVSLYQVLVDNGVDLAPLRGA